MHIADYGTKTCAGYPGSIKHIKKDAQVSQNYHNAYILRAAYMTSQFTLPALIIICEHFLLKNVAIYFNVTIFNDN